MMRYSELELQTRRSLGQGGHLLWAQLAAFLLCWPREEIGYGKGILKEGN